MPVAGETLDFKVIEFVKGTKRITSLTPVWHRATTPRTRAVEKHRLKRVTPTQKAVKMINSAVEKTTRRHFRPRRAQKPSSPKTLKNNPMNFRLTILGSASALPVVGNIRLLVYSTYTSSFLIDAGEG